MEDLAILAIAISLSVPIQITNTAIEKTFTPKILKIISEQSIRPLISIIGSKVLLMTSLSALMSLIGYLLLINIGPMLIDGKFYYAFELYFGLLQGYSYSL